MTQTRQIWVCLALLSLLGAPAQLGAQEPPNVRRVVLPSLDSQVAARLKALDRKLHSTFTPELAAGLVFPAPTAPFGALTPLVADARSLEIWDELAEEYHRTAQEAGDALVTLEDAPLHLGLGWSSVQARRLCQERLASLPRASLEQYRRRVDLEARVLLEQGRRNRSPLPLRRIVDEFLCSTHGGAALDLLGDLAFERGHFDEARAWWRLLAPLEESAEGRIAIPLSQDDRARTHAKQILAMIFQDRLAEAGVESARFKRRHPHARGSLAGQDDRLADILIRTLADFRKANNNDGAEPWTTFGGDASRQRLLTHSLSCSLWEYGPAWRVPLPRLFADVPADRVLGASPSLRKLAFHPIIVHDQVLLADHRSVVSYHLATGQVAFRYERPNLKPGVDRDDALPRFTMSADRERAYVRLGRTGIGPNLDGASYLICLDLTEPGVDKPRELWQVKTREERSFFEGAPLVHDGRLYVAQSRVVGRRVVSSIVCFDTLGRQRWSREVCDSPEFEDQVNGTRHRHHLLTLAGNQIVYGNHAGAIVAVDIATGQPTWAVRYPSHRSAGPEESPARELTPALHADGRLLAAPADCDRVFCIDSATGRICWELEDIESLHLLGVAHGRLLANVRPGLVGIDVASGGIAWSQPRGGRLPTLGRGLLAGELFYWPTQDNKLPYRLVELRSGAPARLDPSMLSSLPVGNLAFGQGCLAIAGTSELLVFLPAHQLRQLPRVEPRPFVRRQVDAKIASGR